MKTSFSLFAVLVVAQVSHAQPVLDQHMVVPGQRIGRVFLGDTRAAVMRRLGKPTKTFQIAKGITSDLFRGSVRRDTEEPHTLEVLFKGGVVIQIETTNPTFKTKSGLHVLSSSESWEKLLQKPTISYYEYPKRRDSVYQYHDWRRAGIAVEMIETETEAMPETLIVHRKNYRVIADVGGIRIP